MAALTVQVAVPAGVTLTENAPDAGGDTFTNNGQTAIIVYNNTGATLTFDAVTTQVVESDLDVEDRSYSLANGDYELIGTFSQNVYSSTVSLSNYSTAGTLANAVIFVFKLT